MGKEESSKKSLQACLSVCLSQVPTVPQLSFLEEVL